MRREGAGLPKGAPQQPVAHRLLEGQGVLRALDRQHRPVQGAQDGVQGFPDLKTVFFAATSADLLAEVHDE